MRAGGPNPDGECKAFGIGERRFAGRRAARKGGEAMSLEVKIRKRLGGFVLDAEFETGGGVTGLLGESGCGKSMTLKCIAGVERPDEGRIALDGEVLFDSEKGIDVPPQKRRVGYLFQSGALFDNMTVERNILCGLRGEKDAGERRRLYREAVAMMRLGGLEKKRPGELSGGQAQRVALARIWVSRPRMLLLDEPFSALDAHLSEQIQVELSELLRRFGRDALLVTHSRDEAYRLCGSIAVMHEGRVIAAKETRALFDDPGSVAAARITGCKNIAPARKASAREVEVPQWGVRLSCARDVGDGLCAVGIRAHDFDPAQEANRRRVVFAGAVEEPFAWIVRFRFEGQAENVPALWWRLPKGGAGCGEFPDELGVAAEDVLLLYGGKCG